MKKPRCKLIGENGNIYNIVGIVRRVLYAAGLEVEAQEMTNRILNSKSYEEALHIITEYVEVH